MAAGTGWAQGWGPLLCRGTGSRRSTGAPCVRQEGTSSQYGSGLVQGWCSGLKEAGEGGQGAEMVQVKVLDPQDNEARQIHLLYVPFPRAT